VIVALLVSRGWACSCLFDPFGQSIPGLFSNANVVMKVRVLSQLSTSSGAQATFVDSPSGVSPLDDINANVFFVAVVKKFFKGCPPTYRSVVITTGGNSATCGFNFDIGQEYLFVGSNTKAGVLGSRELDVYSTNLCSATRPWRSVTPLERLWLLGQQYTCGNKNLCSSGIHSALFKRCSEACPPCADQAGLVCKTSLCKGCGLAAATLYQRADPFAVVNSC